MSLILEMCASVSLDNKKMASDLRVCLSDSPGPDLGQVEKSVS